ncbi:MAG: serine/threonine protein kinase [Muribaculaceae bacterium]|nr:serine/threonine protein kinase [Muribaculaceae bacterium]
MASIRIQGDNERLKGIYFEFDPEEAPLGEGGMGVVYKGWCCSVASDQRREVAIKFLYSDLWPHVIARARREASVQLRNDNLVEMLGFVEVNDHDEMGKPVVRFHVISEYLHGVTLDRLMEGKVTDHRGAVIPYCKKMYDLWKTDPYEFAMVITRGLLSGLMALHDANYIHRDIDPSNIMITSDGKVKLIDFGIAKKIDADNTKDSQFTVDGQFMGKPKYAAPELVRGLIPAQNAQTDLYAVGILLFQLVVGHAPFEGEVHDILNKQIHSELPLKEVKQKKLREVIRRATRKEQNRRFGSAAEFRVALDKIRALPYPDRGFDLGAMLGAMSWKKIAVTAAAVAAVAAGVTALVMYVGDHSVKHDPDADEDIELLAEESDGNDAGVSPRAYSEATAMLADPARAEEGFEKLQALADAGDYQSLFLLSRLYFSSRESIYVGEFSDSVSSFKKNINVAPDNAKAHALLGRAIAVNGNDYRSLFEMGCDFKSRNRGATFNPDSAYIYLDRARKLAAGAGDNTYISAIAGRISNLTPVKY